MSLPEFLLITLATFRLARLVARESGPKLIRLRYGVWVPVFQIVRDWAGVVPDADEQEPGSLADLLTCVWCLSIWIGTALCVAWWIAPGVVVAVCVPLAVSAVASIVFDVEQRI